MIPTALTIIDNCLFIDNSTFEYAVTCPRSFEFYALKKRESNVERAALEFGSKIHEILEARYRLGTTLTPTVEAAMSAKCHEVFATYTPPEDDYRTITLATQFITEYNRSYPVEGFEVVNLSNGTPAIELPFAVPIGELAIDSTIPVRDAGGNVSFQQVGTVTVIWKGRMDMLTRRDGNIYPLDHKTTSMMGPSYFKDFELSHQVSGYSWAVWKLLGIMPTGFIINGLGIRKPTKTGKGFENQRYTVNITADRIHSFVDDTLQILSTLIHYLIEQRFPKGTKWCQGKYGACQFFDVCTLPTNQQDMMLATNQYKTVTWDPLLQRG